MRDRPNSSSLQVYDQIEDQVCDLDRVVVFGFISRGKTELTMSYAIHEQLLTSIVDMLDLLRPFRPCKHYSIASDEQFGRKGFVLQNSVTRCCWSCIPLVILRDVA